MTQSRGGSRVLSGPVLPRLLMDDGVRCDSTASGWGPPVFPVSLTEDSRPCPAPLVPESSLPLAPIVAYGCASYRRAAAQ